MQNVYIKSAIRISVHTIPNSAEKLHGSAPPVHSSLPDIWMQSGMIFAHLAASKATRQGQMSYVNLQPYHNHFPHKTRVEWAPGSWMKWTTFHWKSRTGLYQCFTRFNSESFRNRKKCWKRYFRIFMASKSKHFWQFSVVSVLRSHCIFHKCSAQSFLKKCVEMVGNMLVMAQLTNSSNPTYFIVDGVTPFSISVKWRN